MMELTKQLYGEVPATSSPVLTDVGYERIRQEQKWGEQNHPDGTGEIFREDALNAQDACSTAFEDGYGTWAHILGEEYWESQAESDPDKLRAELVQVAAVAVSWIEAIDRRSRHDS